MSEFKAELIQRQLKQSGSIDAAAIALADSQPSNQQYVYHRRSQWRKDIIEMIKKGKVNL